MTTGSDTGLSVIRAHDVQNPLHFGDMKVRPQGRAGPRPESEPPLALGLALSVGSGEGRWAGPQPCPEELRPHQGAGKGAPHKADGARRARAHRAGLLEGRPGDGEDALIKRVTLGIRQTRERRLSWLKGR